MAGRGEGWHHEAEGQRRAREARGRQRYWWTNDLYIWILTGGIHHLDLTISRGDLSTDIDDAVSHIILDAML